MTNIVWVDPASGWRYGFPCLWDRNKQTYEDNNRFCFNTKTTNQKKKKNQKLNSLSQTHAKVDTTELTSLDQIWGFNELSRYGTLDENEYKDRLILMTRADLENHARSTGVLVVESSERLRDLLLKQFRSYVLSLRKPASQNPKETKLSKDAEKVLREGR